MISLPASTSFGFSRKEYRSYRRFRQTQPVSRGRDRHKNGPATEVVNGQEPGDPGQIAEEFRAATIPEPTLAEWS
jgi:hypothetical protein